MKGLKQYPDDVELRYQQAVLHHTLGQRSEAARAYEELRALQTSRHLSSVDRGLQGSGRQERLGAADVRARIDDGCGGVVDGGEHRTSVPPSCAAALTRAVEEKQSYEEKWRKGEQRQEPTLGEVQEAGPGRWNHSEVAVGVRPGIIEAHPCRVGFSSARPARPRPITRP